jgi:predicted DNA-binding protein
LRQFADEIDISVFDELKAKHMKERIEFDIIDDLEDLEDEINKLDELNNAQKSKLTASIKKLTQLLLFDPQNEQTNRDD